MWCPRCRFVYKTFSKGRWVGRALSEVFATEFASETPEYYAGAIADGRITVNGRAVGGEYAVRHNDQIAHEIHRHEPPVVASPIAVIFEDDDYLVVNKPSSIPVHPTGRYRSVLASVYVVYGVPCRGALP